PPSPYDTAFARWSASSASSTRFTTSTGPNVSSRTAEDDSGTSTRIVGSTYGGRTASMPPSATVAPESTASAMCRRITSTCDGIVIGPTVESSAKPTFNPLAAETSLPTNSSATDSTTYTRSMPMQVCPAL